MKKLFKILATNKGERFPYKKDFFVLADNYDAAVEKLKNEKTNITILQIQELDVLY